MDKGPEPSKPPSLFDEGSSYSYFGNLVALLRTNSGPSGDKGQADAGEALSRAAPSAEVELPPDFPQSYLGFCKVIVMTSNSKAPAAGPWNEYGD